MSDKISLVVGPCQIRFPNLDKTEEFGGVDTGKFSATFMFDADSPSVKEMTKAIAKANGGRGNNPLSQIPEDAEYDPGMYKIKGKSKFRVKVVDRDNKIVDADRVHGATVQAMLGFAPYTAGGGGVACYLNAIRILKEGEGSGSIDFGALPEGYEPELFPDDYRCFLLDWPETESTYVTGFYAEPGNMKIVHHVIAFLISPEHVAEYEAMDAESEAPGYTCFGGPGGDPSSATGWIGAWAPGDVGGNTPPGTGIPVEPGSKIALQVHYDAGLFEEGMLDQTTVHFKLDDTVEKPAFVLPFTNYQWLGGSGMEIPAGGKSVSHNHLFDPTPFLGWSMLSDGLIPSNTAFEIHSTGLHMHELGKKIKVEVHRQNGDRTCLLQIDEWDFNWQGGYTLENFDVFEPGDKLYIECEWDNSAENQRVIDGEQQEPRDVHWGEGTSDEMCLAILYITPH